MSDADQQNSKDVPVTPVASPSTDVDADVTPPATESFEVEFDQEVGFLSNRVRNGTRITGRGARGARNAFLTSIAVVLLTALLVGAVLWGAVQLARIGGQKAAVQFVKLAGRS